VLLSLSGRGLEASVIKALSEKWWGKVFLAGEACQNAPYPNFRMGSKYKSHVGVPGFVDVGQAKPVQHPQTGIPPYFLVNSGLPEVTSPNSLIEKALG